MKLRNRRAILAMALTSAVLFALSACAKSPAMSRDQVENIVNRSYQYVALYNVINKTVLTPETNPMGTGAWNRLKLATKLFDASVTALPRPNNDSLYQMIDMDLRDDAMILEAPVFDSKDVSLETSAFDHYCSIPASTRQGDFQKPMKFLFYTARTKGYKAGETVEGIDRYLEMSGDFVAAFFRVMPHANDPARFERIVGQIGQLRALSLSEYRGQPARTPSAVQFPSVGKTNADVFGDNLLEVMQFVFNHTTFDPNDALDRALLAAYKPLGVEPGKAWNPATAAKIDGALFRQVALEVTEANLAITRDPARAAALLPRMFLPKGQSDLDVLVFQSVLGPIGQPASEALYPSVNTADGQPMNALHDYVIKMTKDELPPAKAFWSLTLYDTKTGFFIPNARNKYSVGENSGFKLNAEGGIEIHIAAEKPDGVPDENWLPIARQDENLDVILRIYIPDLDKMKTWTAPKALLVK